MFGFVLQLLLTGFNEYQKLACPRYVDVYFRRNPPINKKVCL